MSPLIVWALFALFACLYLAVMLLGRDTRGSNFRFRPETGRDRIERRLRDIART